MRSPRYSRIYVLYLISKTRKIRIFDIHKSNKYNLFWVQTDYSRLIPGRNILADNGIDRLTVRRNDLRLKIIVYAVSIAVALITLYPFILLLTDFTGFKLTNPEHVLKVLPKRWTQLVKFFKTRNIRGFINSVIVAVSSTVLNIYFSALTAHAITSYKWKLRKVFSNFILALMMIPTVVATGGFIQLVYKFHLTSSLSVLILPAIATPMSVVFMRLYLEATFPQAIMDSARIDGASEFRIFNQIVLPIMKPAIATQALFAFVSSWNDVFLPLVLLLEENKKTLPVILILNYAMGETTIPMFVTTVPPVIVFLFLSKHIVEGIQLGSVKM